MTWSTRELAELAGTTVKTVRHYHQIGLLDEPERSANGYKLYGVDHLVRLLRVKRLSDLGVPLAQIPAMGAPETQSADALRTIDAELAASIERLQRVRAELALILQHQAPTDLPPGFSDGAGTLSDADRALILIYSRVFSASAMEDLSEMVEDAPHPAMDAEFDALPPDAEESVRQSLADRYAPYIRELTETYPWLAAPGTEALRGREQVGSVIGESIRALYNPAQIDVMARAHGILHGQPAH